jgi:hypothetical protein
MSKKYFSYGLLHAKSLPISSCNQSFLSNFFHENLVFIGLRFNTLQALKYLLQFIEFIKIHQFSKKDIFLKFFAYSEKLL